MILFGSSVSPFTRKVLMYAAERNIALDNKPMPPHQDEPAFLAASPLGKIPALQDDDFCLADSSAIVHYLEAKFPEGTLLPQEPQARGMAIWYDEYADTVMSPLSTALFVNRALLPKVKKVPGDLAKADEAEQQVPRLYDYLESVVPGDGFLVGDSLTLADIAIVNQLINLGHGGVPIDAVQYPTLAAYYQRIATRPSVCDIVAAERTLLGD